MFQFLKSMVACVVAISGPFVTREGVSQGVRRGRKQQRKPHQLGYEKVEDRVLLAGGGIGVTTDALQAQINALTQQLSQLNAGGSQNTSGVTAGELQEQLNLLMQQLYVMQGGGSCQSAPPVDADLDGDVTPKDALLFIIDINTYGVHHKDPMKADQRPIEAVDPNGDGLATPADVMYVVSWLNQHGSGKLLDCVDLVQVTYKPLGDITVAPGTSDVLVASATMTSLNNEYVFPSQVTASGDSGHMMLKADSQWISGTWQQWKTMGLGNSTLGPWTSKTFELWADIDQNASGDLKFGFQDWVIQAFPGARVNVVSGSNYRTVHVQKPSLTVSVDAGTPVSQVVAGGQTVTAAKFKFTAAVGAYEVDELKVTVPSTMSSAVILSASLVDGTTVLATMPFSSTTNNLNDTAYFTGLDLVIPANTSKSLMVWYALSTPSADYGTDGQNLKTTLSYVRAVDASNGETVKMLPNLSGNDLYEYKSFPTFGASPVAAGQGVNLSGGALTSLFSFQVAVDQRGQVALKEIDLSSVVTDAGMITNPILSGFRIFQGSTDITGDGVFTVQPSGDVSFLINTEWMLPAGSVYTYTLKAVGKNFMTSGNGSDSVTTTLKGVTWSSVSAVAHDYVLGRSSDWYDGAKLGSLPTKAMTVTAQ